MASFGTYFHQEVTDKKSHFPPPMHVSIRGSRTVCCDLPIGRHPNVGEGVSALSVNI